MTAPLAQVPPGDPATNPGETWFDTATGTTSALTIPANASGAILVNGPSKFTIESDLSPNADGSKSFPTALACTQVSGEDLTLARITVEPVGSQQIDVTNDYTCELWSNNLPTSVPTDGELPNGGSAQPITAEIKLTLPTTVSPGATIPATDITDTWEMPVGETGVLLVGKANSKSIDGTMSAALTTSLDDQTTVSPLNNMAYSVPFPPAAPFFMPAMGTTSAITVPAGASGDLTINAPRRFEVDWARTNLSGVVNLRGAMECQATDDDLTLATIHVAQPAAHAALSTTSPKSSAFGNPVTVPVGTSVPAVTPKQVAAGGTQSVTAIKVYHCDTWDNATSVPTDGTAPNATAVPVPTQIQTTLPASVDRGDTIPATNLALDFGFSGTGGGDTANVVNAGLSAGIDQVNITDAALGVDVGSQTSTSALTGQGNSALNPPPPPDSSNLAPGWLVTTTGTTSPISVPANANTGLTIDAPQTFDVTYTLEPNDAGTSAGDTPTPIAQQCTLVDPPSIANVDVLRPLPAITHPVPTGKVLIMRGSKGVAQGTIVKGKANVVIPGTALPVGKNTLTVKYTGDSNTLAATPKTITVVKTKTSPTLAVHVTPGKVAAGAIFPTVNVRLTGPGSAKGGKITVTAGTVHKTATLLFDGTTSVQLPPFASAGHKLIRVSYAGNANFVAKTVTAGLNVTKTGLGKFVVKIKPGKVIAKKTRATLLITLGAPDKLNHGMVTVKLAGRVIAKKVITGTGKITLPKFPSAGRKVLHLTFAGNGSVIAKTVTKPVKVIRAPKHHRK